MKLTLQATPPDTRIWSAQQQLIFNAVQAAQKNLLVEAVAGSGKTTTLVKACEHMSGTVAFCAYNKAIAEEIKVRVSSLGNVTAGTFHSFGFKAWMAANPGKIKVDGFKIGTLQDEQQIPWGIRKFSKDLVGYLRQILIHPADENFHQICQEIVEMRDLEDQLSGGATVAQGVEWTRKLLDYSNELGPQVIDFDDMMYLPLLHNVKFPKFDWVLIDEAQDTNLARRLIATKMLRDDGHLIAVGDRNQAIYGFTGADSDSMDLIKQHFGCIELPLTVTYRCGKEIVNHARKLVSHITAKDNAHEGKVRMVDLPAFHEKEVAQLRREDAILCRNTRPLISLAFELIRRNVGCHVEGREIGQGLITLAKKGANDFTPISELRENIQEYMEKEVAKWLRKNQEVKAAQIEDQCQTLFVIFSQMGERDPLSAVIRKIQSLFGDTEPGKPSPNLTLSTIHKSKGREWDRVYFYGRNAYCPSKYAKESWQLQQETNLEYVAITRARNELVEVTL